ncbi:hypothetical protein LO772_01240 [Yinghuangia sp. ASG 101]|uniref:hypothetical protein n=1 Tax=Yinghuangia sp. ASG 101 TaxID=2896848 RepID=UPI001E390C9C|nr:hypothetical protein [Yinghuangia sp. ASG 101]UGQ12267.1 hypothetical protein LO772_01240 [Yinghuangia sp. ASG 101]
MVAVEDETPVPLGRKAASAAGFFVRLVFGVGSVGALLAGLALALAEPAWEPAVAGLVPFAVVWALLVIRSRRRDAASPPPAPRLALARIESRRATGSEGVDIPVRMDLTVAPDDAPAFRVDVTHTVNLVDLPDYRVGATIVVRYRPDTLWPVDIVDEPTTPWNDRAATEPLDTAPEHTRAKPPTIPGPEVLAATLLLATGATIMLLAFPPW